MRLTYNDIDGAFLGKITEFEFAELAEADRLDIIDGYMRRAASTFRKNCKYDLSQRDDVLRIFLVDFDEDDVDEIIDILSEGMLVQWMKQYLYKQEVLENTLNTVDYTTYSPAELLMRISAAYEKVQKDYIQMIREYSYNHGDLGRLHT